MLRFLSKRFGRSTRTAKSRSDSNKVPPKHGKNVLPCKIILLDGTDMSVDVHFDRRRTGLDSDEDF